MSNYHHRIPAHGRPRPARPTTFLVVTVTALAVLLVLLVAAPALAARRPLPTTPPHTITPVRCVALEDYPTGTLNGCTDGRLTFTPHKRTARR